MKVDVLESKRLSGEAIWSVAVSATEPPLVAVANRSNVFLFTLAGGILSELSVIESQHTKSIRSIDFKPITNRERPNEYPTLAVASFDSTISLYGADEVGQPWEMLATLEGHESEVKCVRFTNGKLATCGRDKSVWLWDVDEMCEEVECNEVLNDHEGDVKCLCWLPTGELVSGSYDDSLRIYRQYEDSGEWDCVAKIDIGSTVWSLDFNAGSGELDVGTEGKLLFYRCQNKESSSGTIRGSQEWVLVREESRDGVVYCLNNGLDSVTVEHAITSELMAKSGNKAAIVHALGKVLTFAKCGEYLVVGDDAGWLRLCRLNF